MATQPTGPRAAPQQRMTRPQSQNHPEEAASQALYPSTGPTQKENWCFSSGESPHFQLCGHPDSGCAACRAVRNKCLLVSCHPVWASSQPTARGRHHLLARCASVSPHQNLTSPGAGAPTRLCPTACASTRPAASALTFQPSL